MPLNLSINFDGNCREAVDFYSKVFRSKVQNLMTYSESPPDTGYVVAEVDKDKILFASLSILGCDVMFMDMPSDAPLVKGNNYSPVLVTTDIEEIKRLYSALQEGGNVDMELQETFWSNLYGMVTDKYGIIWQLSHDSGKEY